MAKANKSRSWLKQSILTHKSLLMRILALMIIASLLIWIFVWLDTRSSTQIKFDVQVADAFSKFAIGFGALATGLGGFSLIEDWLKKQSTREDIKESLIEKWSKIYPPEKYNTTYRLIQDREAPGVLYIQDIPSGAKHWITDPGTLRDLGLDYSQVESVDSSFFKEIPSSGNISTRPTE